MKLTATLAATATLFIAACAQSPDAIAPIPLGGAYDSVNCGQVANMLNQERAQLAALSAQQSSAQTGDFIGVFLIGVPVSSLSGGDKAGQIGASKGKVMALEQRLLACS